MVNETEIIKRAKDGDQEAMAFLIEDNQKNVFALAYRMTGNRDDALDITQDTFIKAIRGIKRFRGDSKISTWLYSIASNLAKDHLRKHGRIDLVSLEESWLKAGADSPFEKTSDHERAKLVKRAITALPPNMRAAFILRYEKDLPLHEIADILGKSEGTIKAQIFQAKDKIRAFLDE